jgi:integrase
VAIARKVRKNGSIAYYVVRRVDGRRRWYPGSFATETEARIADAKLTVAKSKGLDVRPKRETVGTMVEAWLAAKATSGKHRARTADLYRAVLRTWVPDAFMKMRTSDVRTGDVQAVIDAVAARGLASASVLKTHRVLSAAFGHAVRSGKLSSNPCANVELPQAHRRPLLVPSGEQVRRILDASDGHQLHGPLVVASYTGLRRGEVAALAWDDVDLDAAMLTVRRASTFRGQMVTFERPKTDSASRRVPLHPAVVEVLRKQQTDQKRRRLAIGPGWRDTLQEVGGIVFDNGDGSPIHPNRLTLYARRLTARLGMPGVRLHDLRHFAATEALKAGVPPLIVSRMVGHSRISTTADIYGHVVAEDMSAAAAAIGDALGAWDRVGADGS